MARSFGTVLSQVAAHADRLIHRRKLGAVHPMDLEPLEGSWSGASPVSDCTSGQTIQVSPPDVQNGSISDDSGTLWSPGTSVNSFSSPSSFSCFPSTPLSPNAATLDNLSTLSGPLANSLGHDQGRAQVCWSYAIGNAIALGAQRGYGVRLNPETLAHQLMTEFRHFGQHHVPRVLQYLQERWADPAQPFTLFALQEVRERLVPDFPVCVFISDVTHYGAQEFVAAPERPGWYKHDSADFDAFREACTSPTMSAVVSIWLSSDGDLRADGHAVAFLDAAGAAVTCKNSHADQPFLSAHAANFKGAVAFRVHVCKLEDSAMLTSRYGCHNMVQRGDELPTKVMPPTP